MLVGLILTCTHISNSLPHALLQEKQEGFSDVLLCMTGPSRGLTEESTRPICTSGHSTSQQVVRKEQGLQWILHEQMQASCFTLKEVLSGRGQLGPALQGLRGNEVEAPRK